jgi:hypothetical protein
VEAGRKIKLPAYGANNGGTHYDLYGNRNLRDLLARRYARANRHADATRYFSGDTAKRYAQYAADIRIGENTKLPLKKRTDALWRAARYARSDGITILATELEPDFAIWAGSYSIKYGVLPMRKRLYAIGGIVAPTEDERQRVAKATVPEKRFHYRYRAADLAWQAASLMPDDSEETAQLLNEAGNWLKARDPRVAERFYHAILKRCANTPTGKAAKARKWFLEEKKPAKKQS